MKKRQVRVYADTSVYGTVLWGMSLSFNHLKSKEVMIMQKLTSLAFLFMVLTFFVGNTNAIEIQTENDDFHQKLKSFDEKIDKFLIEKPFPDAFFNVNMEKASVIQNKWGSGDFLEVEFSLEYNNETLHELDHFFLTIKRYWLKRLQSVASVAVPLSAGLDMKYIVKELKI